MSACASRSSGRKDRKSRRSVSICVVGAVDMRRHYAGPACNHLRRGALSMESNEHDAAGYDRRTFVAEYYDFVPPYANRADRQFYVDYARNAGGPVLELGCGTGRLLIPIARSGVSITGLDLSRAMLDRCREQLGQEPSAVQASASTHYGDMTQFSLGRKFALATVPFRA